MNKAMTPAATVRRNFQLGRPAKETEALPLHRRVVWERATAALLRFRDRMEAAGLKRDDATAMIVYAEAAAPMEPKFLLLETVTTQVDVQAVAYEVLGRDDVTAVGLMFRQTDRQGGKDGGMAYARFPYPLTGLNAAGVGLLRLACVVDQASDEASLKTLV